MLVLAVLGTAPLLQVNHRAQAQQQSRQQSQIQSQAMATVELRGVWLTANDMPVLRDRPRMQQAVAELAQLNFNTLYIVVWNDGMAYYPSTLVQ